MKNRLHILLLALCLTLPVLAKGTLQPDSTVQIDWNAIILDIATTDWSMADSLNAQDTLVYDTVMSVNDFYDGTYADTVRLNDLPRTTEMDDWLLQLVTIQGQRLYGLDSTRDYTVADVLRMDSLRKDMEMLDSLKRSNADIVVVKGDVKAIAIQKSWIRDTEEDKQDVKRALKDMKTPWRKDANISLQMTQNYVTNNWYQGGTPSFAVLSLIKGNIGYYSSKFTWENTGEWRAGSSTVSGDTLRKINTTDDKFRLYSKANYQIFKQMYASFSAEYEMQMLKTYKANQMKMKSSFASPLRLNLGLGVDYKPITGLSILFSPLAYKMVYVMDTVHVKQTDFSVPVGEKILNDVGSSLRVEYIWKPVREIVLDSKFYMYTNYKRVELDLEIDCDFVINRFLSARVTLHPRYDNTVILSGDDKAKIQFKELVSFGFAHKFK